MGGRARALDREYGETEGNREGNQNQRRPYCSGIDHTLLFFSNSLSSEVK